MRFYYELQTDMVISDSTVTPLRLFYDIHKLGWGIREVQNIESGCFQGELGSDATVYSLCIGVPHLIPVSTSTTPTIDRYHIYNSGQVAATAGGMMTFYLNSDNQILGGLLAGFILQHRKTQALMHLIWPLNEQLCLIPACIL